MNLVQRYAKIQCIVGFRCAQLVLKKGDGLPSVSHQLLHLEMHETNLASLLIINRLVKFTHIETICVFYLLLSLCQWWQTYKAQTCKSSTNQKPASNQMRSIWWKVHELAPIRPTKQSLTKKRRSSCSLTTGPQVRYNFPLLLPPNGFMCPQTPVVTSRV